MMTKSGQWPRIAETTAAASIMKAIGPMKQRSTFRAKGSSCSAMPFGPYLARREAASAAVRPWSGLTPRVASTWSSGALSRPPPVAAG